MEELQYKAGKVAGQVADNVVKQLKSGVGQVAKMGKEAHGKLKELGGGGGSGRKKTGS